MADPIKVIKGLLEAEEDLGEFIRGGPSDGLPGYVRDRFRDRCDEFANLPPWARALSGVAGGSIGRFCRPYWDDNGWDGPTVDRPFNGGQCPENYTVSVLINGNLLNVGGESPKTIVGPLGGVTRTAEQVSGGPFPEFTVVWAFSNDPATKRVTVRLNQGQLDASEISVVPQSGNPDDCGDPPGELVPGPNPPPNPGPLPGPEPTDNPDPDNPIPIFPIPPFDDPVFGPQPITGPSDSPPPAAPAPPAGGDGLPGDPDAIGGEAGEVSGGDDGENVPFGEPPEGRIWVGCIVETTTDSRVGNIPGTGPQSTVWPSVRANVALRYGSFLGKSERINSRFYDVFRPNTSLTVTGCFLQVQAGSTSKVFPVSALKCPENPCEVTDG